MERQKAHGQATSSYSSVLWENCELSPSSEPIVQHHTQEKAQYSETGAMYLSQDSADRRLRCGRLG